MGKKPFSAKAKREQLRQKRLAAATNAPHPRGTAANKQQQQASSASSQPPSQPSASSPTAPRTQTRGRAPRGAHAQRFRLQLSEDGGAAARNKPDVDHLPITRTGPVESAVSDIRPFPDDRFTMPRRPPWRYDEDVETIDRRETAAFRTWRERIAAAQEGAPFYEHNLETWRQLWRVLERSDVIVIVADIRFPALHFVPDLYHHVADELGKGVVLALNKCDLVSLEVVRAWQRFFAETYPRLAVALFSSFPDAKLAASRYNSDLLSKRERRMARSKLSAWGADQLLQAVQRLDLPSSKLAFLKEWRERLHGQSSDNDDEGAAAQAAAVNVLRGTDSGEGRSKRAKAARKRRRPPSGAGAGATAVVGASVENGQAGRQEADSTCDNMITIGVVGHPNAGKSTLINGIFQRKVVSTSKTPGHTKHLQTMFLSDGVRLCDCPGLVFPGLASRELQILGGMFPIAQVRDPISVVRYLAERTPLTHILALEAERTRLADYALEPDYLRDGWTAWKICEAWAMKRGYHTAKAARLDVSRAANHILRLALEGRVVLSTVPLGFTARHDGEGDDGADNGDGDDNGNGGVGDGSLIGGLRSGDRGLTGERAGIGGDEAPDSDADALDDSESESECESESESGDDDEDDEEGKGGDSRGGGLGERAARNAFEVLNDEQ